MLAIGHRTSFNPDMDDPYLPPATESSPPPLPAVEKEPWNIWWTLLWGVVLFFAWQTVQGIGMIIYMAKEGIFGEIVEKKGQLSNEELMAMLMDGDLLGTISFLSILSLIHI